MAYINNVNARAHVKLYMIKHENYNPCAWYTMHCKDRNPCVHASYAFILCLSFVLRKGTLSAHELAGNWSW